MCGRLACTLNKDELQSACQYKTKDNNWVKPDWVETSHTYKPFYNGPPTTNVAVLANANHFTQEKNNAENAISIATMKWGLLPSKIPKEGLKTLHTHNARFETFTQSPLYKPCLTNGQRCVVLAEGYYEWQTTKGENNKQPYYLYQEVESDEQNKFPEGKNLIKFAGLFNKTNIDDKIKWSCTIITKESDESMSWIHHRMPVILNTQEVENWLNYKIVNEKDAVNGLKMLERNPKFEIKYYKVNKLYVNKSTFDDKKCMEKLSEKRKSTFLSTWLLPKKTKN